MLGAKDSQTAFRTWMEFGGITTLDSYGETGRINLVPDEHIDFLRSCVPYFETDRHFFVHANYNHELPLDQQDGHTLRWLSLKDQIPKPHFSGKIAIVGHTPIREVLRLPHLIGLDTGCCFDGKLTAMEIETGEVWQAAE